MQFDQQPSLNGHHGPAKATTSTKRAERNATVFLDDLPISNWQSFLHHLSVAQFAGAPLLRLVTFVWIIVTALGLFGAFPGGIWVGAMLLVGLIVFYANFFMHRRTDFVHFEPQTLAVPAPTPLQVEDKVAVYVTGECSVEGKRSRFSCLPGFYRTFATREHALLCQVKERRILGIASWRSAEIGLWYVFFRPETISRIQTVTLHYGRHALPTVAIEHLAAIKFNKMGEPEKTEQQTIYISAFDAEEIKVILADLLVDAAEKITA